MKEVLCTLCTLDTVGMNDYSCESVCERTLDYENHDCDAVCHSGPCRSCVLTPVRVTNCGAISELPSFIHQWLVEHDHLSKFHIILT